MFCQGFWPSTGLESYWYILQASWVIPVWTLPYPSSLGLEQPSPACTSLPDGCFLCDVFHDYALHCGLLHHMPSLYCLMHADPGFLLSSCVVLSLSLPPLFSFSLHLLLPSTFTSQSVVPPWPADTGSESARRHLGDSGQMFFHVACFSRVLHHPFSLSSHHVPSVNPFCSVHCYTLSRRLTNIRMSGYLKKKKKTCVCLPGSFLC